MRYVTDYPVIMYIICVLIYSLAASLLLMMILCIAEHSVAMLIL